MQIASQVVYKWLLAMESSLNVGVGFDDGKGIKINLMAHSLGNNVLMRVLDLCGQNGIQIDHAFLWDAAIPNTYVASLFTYPLSFFTTGKRSMLEGYYQLWQETYPQAQWQTPAGASYKLSSTLETQRSQMAFYYPRLFDLISDACQFKDTDTASIDASYNNLTDKEKATAAILHAVNLISAIPGLKSYAALSVNIDAEEHAKDVAAIILTALLCTNVQPDQALGYTGIPVNVPSYSVVKAGKAFQSGQTKPGTKPTDPDHYLCKDHDAMLFPTPDFMQYIYKQYLLRNPQGGFEQFGTWPLVGSPE